MAHQVTSKRKALNPKILFALIAAIVITAVVWFFINRQVTLDLTVETRLLEKLDTAILADKRFMVLIFPTEVTVESRMFGRSNPFSALLPEQPPAAAATTQEEETLSAEIATSTEEIPPETTDYNPLFP